MIVSHLEKIATAKGYDRAKLNRAADISYPAVLRMWKKIPLKQIDADVLDKLCSVLNCEPGDIIKREVVTTDTPTS